MCLCRSVHVRVATLESLAMAVFSCLAFFAVAVALVPEGKLESEAHNDALENSLRANNLRQTGASSVRVNFPAPGSAQGVEMGVGRLSLSRLFSLVETERMTEREIGSPCPTIDQRNALTALLLTIVFPPSAHFYYGYTVLGIVQLIFTLLMYFPLFLACGWWFKPVQQVPRQPMCYENDGDHASTMRKRIKSRVTVLMVAVGTALFLAAVLTAWQIAMLIRIATNDLQPANGCPPKAL